MHKSSLVATLVGLTLVMSGCATRGGNTHSSPPPSPVNVTVAVPAPTLGAAPKSLLRPETLKAQAGLTFTLIDVHPSLSRGGPEVYEVPASSHSTSGLKVGDVILAFADKPVKTACDVFDALKQLKPYTTAKIEIRRGNQLMSGAILLSESKQVTGC